MGPMDTLYDHPWSSMDDVRMFMAALDMYDVPGVNFPCIENFKRQMFGEFDKWCTTCQFFSTNSYV